MSEGKRNEPILMVAPEPFYEDRGTPIAVRQVVRALSEIGRSVDLITYPTGDHVDYPRLRIDRVENPLRFRSVPIGLSFRKVALDVLIARRIAARLRRREYACVHAVEESIFPTLLSARPRGVPVVYDMQSSLPEQLAHSPILGWRPVHRLLRGCERWAIRRADRIVCSAGLEKRVREICPAADVREWVFPGSLPVLKREESDELRRRLGLSPGAKVILYCGTFEPYQGLSYIVDAVPLVLREMPDAVFLLVGGRGPGRNGPRKGPPLPSRDGRVILLPRQPRSSIPSFLALADIVVSPRAYGENLPLKIFDYMAAGKPIVATESVSHRTVLDESRALLVEKSAEKVADGIVSLLANREEAERLGAAARSYAEAHLSWRSFVEQVRDLHSPHAERNSER